MKKKIALFMCITAAFLSSVMTCCAFADGVNVYLNDELISFPNTQPGIIDGRTLVPLRGVFDAMGYEVDWDAEEKAAYLTKDKTVIETSEVEMILNSPEKSMEIKCDVLPRIINGSFMVPLRAVSEATGAEVKWDGTTRSVYITAEVNDVAEENDGQKNRQENIEGTMAVNEKEYLDTLKECTDYIFKFAVEKNDNLLKSLLFGYEYNVEGTVTSPAGYYDEVQKKIEILKNLEPPAAMSGVQECVFTYLDEIQKVVTGATNGTYHTNQLAESSKVLRDNSQQFGIHLYNYFTENKVNYEMIYGAEILDALKRN